MVHINQIAILFDGMVHDLAVGIIPSRRLLCSPPLFCLTLTTGAVGCGVCACVFMYMYMYVHA
jgi:hypothetical protein